MNLCRLAHRWVLVSCNLGSYTYRCRRCGKRKLTAWRSL